MRELKKRFLGVEGEIDRDRDDGRGAVTWRAFALGIIGVLIIACFAPYNDWILHNTFLIGNHFPLGAMLLVLVLVLAVNPVLGMFGPRMRLSAGEMITVTSMMLVGCAFPTSGLHRYWAAMQVAPVYHLQMHLQEFKPILDALPDWMLPTKDPLNKEVVYAYYQGVRNRPDLGIPWAAWARQAAYWSILIVPLFVGVMCLTSILRRQWVQSEKLQFPLAQVTLELIRDPEPGRRWNRLFRNKWLWVSVAAVGLIHLQNGLHQYFPVVPEPPLSYNLSGAFSEEPWRYMGYFIVSNRIYFSAVGIAFLLTSEVGFSLWFFVVLYGVACLFLGWYGVDYGAAFRTQNVGAYLAAAAIILYVGRRHLGQACRLAFSRGPQPLHEEYISHRWAVRTLLACLAICTGWFVAAGLPVWQALLIVLIVNVMFLVIGRIVAESGLMFVNAAFPPDLAAGSILSGAVTGRQLAVMGVGTLPYGFDLRETLMPYALDSIRMADGSRRMPRHRFFLALIAAVIVSMFVSGIAHIATITYFGSVNGIDRIGDLVMPRNHFTYFAEVQRGYHRSGTGREQVLLGAAILAALALGRLRFARWPLHPIGFLLMPSFTMAVFWFSILLGWLCKSLTMRLGGVPLYERLKPIFIGMILGETMMGGFWMVVKIILELSGQPSKYITIMPG